jgi:membrane protein required for colicin V production
MTAFDYAVLGVIGISVAYSAWRGAVREVMALVGWVVAIVVALAYAAEVEPLLPAGLLVSPEMRMLMAYALVFSVVLFLFWLAAFLLSSMVRKSGMGPADRVVGGVFGLVRGVVIVMALMLAAGLTALPKTPVWRNAALSAPLEEFAVYLKTWLPEELAGRIHYE